MKRKHDDKDKRGKKFKVYRNNETQSERECERPPRAEGDVKLPKRKVAVLLGFCGTDYQGMQFNTGVKTIEGDIFDAFVKTGAVSKDNSDDLSKVSFMRAARTDKGVHAAGNVISLKLVIEDPDIVKKVNDILPPTIRIWGYVRTLRSFHSKNMCDSRVYEYLIPSYVFLSPKKTTCMGSMLGRLRGNNAADDPDSDFWDQDDKKRSYRISKEKVEAIRGAFNVYIGTHNFHNFTVGKSFSERSANRFMKNITVDEPKLIEGTEWLSIKIHGQSFMLHQIRKMVGLVVLVVRSMAPYAKLMPETFGYQRIHVPKAPGLGLLLEKPIFEVYNRRAEKESREAVDFEPHREAIEKFKDEFIYTRIFQEEKNNNT